MAIEMQLDFFLLPDTKDYSKGFCYAAQFAKDDERSITILKSWTF